MEFRGFQPFSLIEYPGKIAAVVWTGGCNFGCPFCYNRDLVLNPGSLDEISREKVLDFLKDRRRWLDGLAITGGEPTMHGDLPEFIRRVKREDFLAMLETNGSNYQMLGDLVGEEMIDYVALDIKAPLNWDAYKKVAKIDAKEDFDDILKSVELLREGKVDYEFRTTFAPKLLSEEDVLKISDQLEGSKKYVLQQFEPRNPINDEFEELDPHPPEKFWDLREEIADKFQNFEVRGVSAPRRTE